MNHPCFPGRGPCSCVGCISADALLSLGEQRFLWGFCCDQQKIFEKLTAFSCETVWIFGGSVVLKREVSPPVETNFCLFRDSLGRLHFPRIQSLL